MRAAIVCDCDVMVCMLIGNISAAGPDASRVVGTANYCREWIDRYIAKLFLETTEPIHVFNAYRNSTNEQPCEWAREVVNRMNSFNRAGIIPAPVFHCGNEWITPFEGLRQRICDFNWGQNVAVRDRGSEVTLVKDNNNYVVDLCDDAIQETDEVYAARFYNDPSQLEAVFSQIMTTFETQAVNLAVPVPSTDTRLIQGWIRTRTQPSTCRCLFKAIHSDHPAFSDDLLSPLDVLVQDNQEDNLLPNVTIIRRDSSYDNGIGIDATSGDGFYIVSYGVGALGDMLLVAVEQNLASNCIMHNS